MINRFTVHVRRTPSGSYYLQVLNKQGVPYVDMGAFARKADCLEAAVKHASQDGVPPEIIDLTGEV